ncbi:alpha/beta hydrolase [Staphylococcus epidermidis]|uniref:alpha/beta hydrolase n=1 Tax=Staphylococcus epidermidis TaxID=1282 RepID=UPI0037D99A14
MPRLYNRIFNVNHNLNEIILDKHPKPTTINPPYPQFLSLYNIYSPNQIQLLNIYAHLQHPSHSHPPLSNTSSQSLQYLLTPTTNSYQQIKFKPPNPQHTQLHHNKHLPNQIIQFLSQT